MSSSLLADWRDRPTHRRVWALAAPMVLSLQVFQKSLPKVSCCSPEMSAAHSALRICVCMSVNF